MFACFYQLCDSQFRSKTVQRVALHYFTAGAGEKAFALSFKMTINDVADNSVKDSISKKFKTFVVERLSLLVALGNTLVHQRKLIIMDAVGIEPEDVV